jgi:hypothetical protein
MGTVKQSNGYGTQVPDCAEKKRGFTINKIPIPAYSEQVYKLILGLYKILLQELFSSYVTKRGKNHENCTSSSRTTIKAHSLAKTLTGSFQIAAPLKSMLCIRIRIDQCCGAMTFWCGSGSVDLQDANKKLIFILFFLLITF